MKIINTVVSDEAGAQIKSAAALAGLTQQEWCEGAFLSALKNQGPVKAFAELARATKTSHAENCKCLVCKPPKQKRGPDVHP